MKANDNRKLKGHAIDKLKTLGYNNVFASDSGSNLIIVTDSTEKIKKLSKTVSGTIFRTKNLEKNQLSFFITLGKRNCIKLEILV